MMPKFRTFVLAAAALSMLLKVGSASAQLVPSANPPARSLNPLPEITDINFHDRVTKSPTATVIVFSGDDDTASVAQNTILSELADSYAGRVSFVHARLVRNAGGDGMAIPKAIANIAQAARLRFVPTLLFVSNNNCNTVTSVGGYQKREQVVDFIAQSLQSCAVVTAADQGAAADDDYSDAPAKETKLNAAQFFREADQSVFGLGVAVRMKDAGKIFDTLPKAGATQEQIDAVIALAKAERLGSQFPMMIDSVTPGSPADLAKLQKGDLITAVNGLSLDGLTLDEGAKKLFPGGADKVALSITRGSDKFTVTVAAGEYLDVY